MSGHCVSSDSTLTAQPGSPAHIELSLSLDEVRRLPNVDPLSNGDPR